MDWTVEVKKKVCCCACARSLIDSKHINLVALDRLATWSMPVFGNILIEEDFKRAVAVICDRCVTSDISKIKFAVEWTTNVGRVTYHKIEDLDLLPVGIFILKNSLKLSAQEPKKNKNKKNSCVTDRPRATL